MGLLSQLDNFSRRSLMVAAGGLAIWGTLLGRLFQLQVLEREQYEDLAADNAVKFEVDPPRRGRILDRFGKELAAHRTAGRVYFVREEVEDMDAMLEAVGQQIELPQSRRDAIKKKAYQQAAFVPTVIVEELTFEDYSRLSVFAADIKGLRVEMSVTRSYPRGRDFAHVIGYVARASDRDIVRMAWDMIDTDIKHKLGFHEDFFVRASVAEESGYEKVEALAFYRKVAQLRAKYNEANKGKQKHERSAKPVELARCEEVLDHLNALFRHPEMRVGRSGVEYFAEDWLRGERGRESFEANAAGRIIKELDHKDAKPATPGKDLYLTIDADLQRAAIDRFGDESGAAVVIDIESGDVLAFVSTPAFDPNDFVNGISQADYDLLRQNDRSPLYHKAYDGIYPPGSTIKMITAAAGLETSAISPTRRVYCPGHYRFGNRTWHCWKKEGHGSVDMHDAIKKSCDVYFYEVARLVGIEDLADLYKRLGFGQHWELGMTGGRPGVVPNDAWKRATQGEKWYEGETLNIGIGQGQLSTTPLHLALMTARIASEGRIVTPRIIGRGPQVTADIPDDQPLDPEIMRRMKRAMYGVTSEAGGTAYRSGDLGLGGPRLAGKTGTAQVRRISAAERRTGVLKGDQLDRKLRDHALFVAYAPADNPQYACSVVVEHGEGGSKAAAPVARDILAYAIENNSRRQADYTTVADLDPDTSRGNL